MLKRIKKSGGFSLIELLAVLAILSILMAVAVPATAGYIKSARKAAAIQSPRSQQTQYSCICMMKRSRAFNSRKASQIDEFKFK